MTQKRRFNWVYNRLCTGCYITYRKTPEESLKRLAHETCLEMEEAGLIIRDYTGDNCVVWKRKEETDGAS